MDYISLCWKDLPLETIFCEDEARNDGNTTKRHADWHEWDGEENSYNIEYINQKKMCGKT